MGRSTSTSHSWWQKDTNNNLGWITKFFFVRVVRLDTMRLVITLVSKNTWPISHLDMKLSFLHGDLVFIEQPHGYVKIDGENKVWKLKMVLYKLKQEHRTWYNRINAYF